jgi:hypothetical protein
VVSGFGSLALVVRNGAVRSGEASVHKMWMPRASIGQYEAAYDSSLADTRQIVVVIGAEAAGSFT